MRAVVLGHTGGTFCAGADLSEASGGDAAETVANNARQLTSLLRSILEMPQPVIGAIDGHVRAGGLGLVGACDIVVAGRNSTFALTEARIGVAPSIISLTLLPKMSARAAGRYFVTGEKFGADEAAEIGLITVAADDVDATVAELTAEIAKGSPQGLAASKRLTTAPMLDAFDRHAEALTRQSAELFVIRGGPRGHAGLPAETPSELGELTPRLRVSCGRFRDLANCATLPMFAVGGCPGKWSSGLRVSVATPCGSDNRGPRRCAWIGR